MKIKFFVPLICLIACSTSTVDQFKNKTDWEMNNIKGKTMTMTKWLYEAKLDTVSGQLVKGKLETVYTYNFNEKGYLTSFNESVPSEDFIQSYQYDGKGYVKEFYRVEMGDTMRDKCSLVLNDKGWVMQEIWLEGGEKLQMRYVNIFDDQGEIISTTAYEPGQDVPKLKQEYIIDEHGNRAEIRFFDSQDVLRQKNVQTFNENREITEMASHRLFGENWVVRYHEYNYAEADATGNWTRQITALNLGDSLNQRFKWTERGMEYFK